MDEPKGKICNNAYLLEDVEVKIKKISLTMIKWNKWNKISAPIFSSSSFMVFKKDEVNRTDSVRLTFVVSRTDT